MARRIGPALTGAIAAAGFLAAAAISAQAESGPWSTSEHASARLLSAVRGTGDLRTIPAGIEVKLDGDWKTYWRSPGDAGLPPTLSWKGSTNLASATLLYPAPQRVTVLGIQTFGYKHDVVFPLDLELVDKSKSLDLALHLDILVCAASGTNASAPPDPVRFATKATSRF